MRGAVQYPSGLRKPLLFFQRSIEVKTSTSSSSRTHENKVSRVSCKTRPLSTWRYPDMKNKGRCTTDIQLSNLAPTTALRPPTPRLAIAGFLLCPLLKYKQARTPPLETPFRPMRRGNSLRPDDPPLKVGQSLADMRRTVKIEISDLGDITLSPTGNNHKDKEPVWAYRAPTTWGNRADGGIGCTAERLLRKAIGKGEIPMTLQVRNGRWRIGRGALCTLGKSSRPEGSLRSLLQDDPRGKALRTASLTVYSDRVVISSGPDVMWDSSLE